MCCLGAITRRWALQTRYTLRRNTASINNERFNLIIMQHTKQIIGRVRRASATETVDLGSILRRVESKTIKIGFHSFLAGCSVLKRTV